jgi:hypothetical protein
MKDTPTYIKALVMPVTRKTQGRRVWSIDLESVWLPFFVATNTMGDTAIPADVLGCPLRLQIDKDGAVKFSAIGRPVIRVAKEISSHVQMVRENFVANLMDYTEKVATENQKAYGDTVKYAEKAGKPIHERQNSELEKAIKARLLAEAEAAAEAETETETEAEKEPALVS